MLDIVQQTGQGTLINTIQPVVFGPHKTPYHQNKGRWLNKKTRGATELNAMHCIGMLVQKAKDGHGIDARDFVTLCNIFDYHITLVSASTTMGYWRQQPGEQCLVFNEKGNLIGGTFAPRPNYLAFTYRSGNKRWKRQGKAKKIKVVINAATHEHKYKRVIQPYDPTIYTR